MLSSLDSFFTQLEPSRDPEDHHNFYPYCVEITNKPTLLITIGDSWTFGGGLDPELRISQVYGKLLATKLNSDWINIGGSGYSNHWCLAHAEHIIQQNKLLKNYEHIWVVFTFTENGRDIVNYSARPFNYINAYKHLPVTIELYNRVLLDIELEWAERLNAITKSSDQRFKFYLGQNFVWHPELVNRVADCVTVFDCNWIELLADYQKLPRPNRTNLVTGWIFDSVSQVNNIIGINDCSVYKHWSLHKIEEATKVNQWMDSSALNNHKSTKHPIALGHQLWADYIIGYL